MIATIFLTMIILGIINHLYLYVTRADNINKQRQSIIEEIIKRERKISNYNVNEEKYTYPLRDYYILSSMNSCVNGESLTDVELNVDTLRDCTRLGCRFLDFEIYQKDGKPVIAVGEYQNRQRWTSTNVLGFEYVMQKVKEYALSGSSNSPNYADPLFLSFRIKTLQNNIYDVMAEILESVFGKKLLNNDEINKEYDHLSKVPLDKLKNKVIIYCKNMNGNDKSFKDTKFEKIVNISKHSSSSSTYDQVVTYNSAIGTRSAGNLNWTSILNNCKQNICLVFTHNEDLTTFNYNKKGHLQNGVQISPINVSSIKLDVNKSAAKEHWNFFNKNKSAFVLKDENLRHKPIVIKDKDIPKQDPRVSYEQRTITTSLGHNFIG
jgi:hypothetical protein